MTLRQGYIDDAGVGHIPLTQGKEALCDAHWFHTLSQHNWQAKHEHNRWYAVHAAKGKRIAMHRVIMGDPEGMEIDHKDRSPEGGLDNREVNLRTTAGQNQQNVGLRKDNKSGFKGVSWQTSLSKWRAEIRYQRNRQPLYLGLFDTAVEAAAVYNFAAKRLHGAFAVLNDLSQVTEEQLEITL